MRHHPLAEPNGLSAQVSTKPGELHGNNRCPRTTQPFERLWQWFVADRRQPRPKERWEEAPDRLHERRLFEHNGDGWSAQLLAP
jgi:pyridoxine/pyridoxamine 5'-phosphate oxidase